MEFGSKSFIYLNVAPLVPKTGYDLVFDKSFGVKLKNFTVDSTCPQFGMFGNSLFSFNLLRNALWKKTHQFRKCFKTFL